MSTRQGLVLTLLVLLAWAVTVAANPPAAAPPAHNPVQVEMQALQAAMQQSVAAIAAGDVRGLPKLLHAVHTAGGDTNKALDDGRYRPPQGKDQLETFRRLDHAFHAEMIKMVKAARKNDVATVAQQHGVLMSKCHACHAVFRHPPAAR